MSIFSKTDNLSKIAIYKLYLEVEVLGLDISHRLAPVSNVNFSKTDNLSKIAIYKLYLEVEVLGLDIRQ